MQELPDSFLNEPQSGHERQSLDVPALQVAHVMSQLAQVSKLL
jgi:hypothetical protein